jgi:putative DNA primase/helicase
MREALNDPSRGVLITEGHKKADAATSRNLLCLGLSGVWSFQYRVRDKKGRKLAESKFCDEWNLIPMDGRKVTIVFDSDLAVNPKVQGARRQLTRFLRERGARLFWVDLPAGQNGAKQGLDDYFVAGHTVADLRALATEVPTRGPEREVRRTS